MPLCLSLIVVVVMFTSLAAEESCIDDCRFPKQMTGEIIISTNHSYRGDVDLIPPYSPFVIDFGLQRAIINPPFYLSYDNANYVLDLQNNTMYRFPFESQNSGIPTDPCSIINTTEYLKFLPCVPKNWIKIRSESAKDIYRPDRNNFVHAEIYTKRFNSCAPIEIFNTQRRNTENLIYLDIFVLENEIVNRNTSEFFPETENCTAAEFTSLFP